MASLPRLEKKKRFDSLIVYVFVLRRRVLDLLPEN